LETPLPAKLSAPQPPPVLAQNLAPLPLAAAIDQEYLGRFATAWQEILAMAIQFIFRAPHARA
jgi:hypothetical protein